MDVNIRTVDQVTIVELAGDLDASTAPAVQTQVLPLGRSGQNLVLDMTQVTYMSSAGLRMLLSLYRQIAAIQGRVILVGLSEEIEDTMSVTGFLGFFDTGRTVEDGLNALRTKSRSGNLGN